MTFHRYVYKLVWKSKLLVPLIFICGLIATVTTLYQSGNLGVLGGAGKVGRDHKHPLQPRYTRPTPVPIGDPGISHDPLEGQEVDISDDSQGDEDEEPDHQHPKHVLPKQDQDILKGYVEEAKKKAENLLVRQKERLKEGVLGETVLLSRGNKTLTAREKRLEKKKRRKPFKPWHSRKLYYDGKDPPQIYSYYEESKESMCNGKFVGYFNEFAVLKDAIFDQEYCHGRKGGEEIADVLNQPEEDEFYTYEMGCVQLACEERPSYFFNNKNHLNDLLFSLQTKDVEDRPDQKVTDGIYFLVTRYEYANIYHTMTDWYNAFLLMNYFNKTQSETNILILDGHPKGALDGVWPVLFNSSHRLTEFKPTVQIQQLVFNTLGYNSPFLDHISDTIPLVEEFREFFLRSFRLPVISHTKNCDSLSVLFIWRRDYLAHPRNPQGTISRKIANERELLEQLQRLYPKFRIKGLQIDLFEMRQQLTHVATSDVLIGMHGAGLTHAMFLPSHAGVIEFIPNYWSAAMEHFLAIAKWRNLHYERWVNSDPNNEEPNNLTRVPPSVLTALFKSIHRQMGCEAGNVGDSEGASEQQT